MISQQNQTILFITLFCLPILYVLQHLNVTVTPSNDHRVFWIDPTPAHVNDYALFPLTHPLLGTETQHISKKLVCGPGQTLLVTGHDYFCDQQLIGTAKTTTSDGKPLEPFVFNGVIPEGLAFAWGSHPDSFDSRYWGLVTLTSTSRLIPIW